MAEELEVSKSTAVAKASSQKSATTLGIIKNYVSSDEIKKRFSEVLGNKAPTFLGSIVSLVSSNTNFNGVDPNTIMASALVAATMDLPINPNLGFAHIIPYSGRAQFQMGYKGFVQLALRTGQYETINATEIYEGELVKRNRLTGEIVIDEDKRTSEAVVGYASYFKLLNGFEKTLYMTLAEVQAHGKKYSKSYGNKNAPWQTDFDGMAKKTVLKLLLSKFGILSVEMQRALEVDQAVVKNENEVEYVDSPATPIKVENLEVESAQVVEKPAEQKSEPADKKPLSRKEIMELLEAVETKAELAKFKGKILVDLDALTALEREEVIQGIHTKEMLFDRPQKEVVAPASESALVIEYKGKIAGSHLKTTLNKYRKEINDNTVLGEDEKTYLVGLITEQMSKAK